MRRRTEAPLVGVIRGSVRVLGKELPSKRIIFSLDFSAFGDELRRILMIATFHNDEAEALWRRRFCLFAVFS
jgi:hypothetical protein